MATSTFRYDAPRFTYEDDEDVTHTVFTDLDFSYVIDLTDWERYRYADDGHRVLSDDRIFDPDWVRLATVEPSPDSVMTPNIERLGDTLLFTDYTLGDDLEYDFRTTIFDFRTHALAGIEGIFVGFDGDAFVADTGDDVIVYDRSTWTALMTYPDRGFAMLSNGFLFLTAGTEMTIVELATGTSATLTIECAFPYSWTTYGYVLSYGGGYYLLG